MGTYGIGVGRTLACVIELMHDENGIIWPMSIAPYHVVIIPIGKEGDEAYTVAEKLYKDLSEPTLPVDPLFDDRNERPGVKFKDADLTGIPIRITVGQKSLDKGCVEFKVRGDKEATLVKLENIKESIIHTYFEKMKELRP
jgi:prolyl-tRNA synthetase